MKKSKKIFFVILSCFVLAFSFLIPSFIQDNDIKVKADSTYQNYSFNGSSWLTFMVYDTTKYTFMNSRCDLSTTNLVTTINFYGIIYLVNYNSNQSYSSYNTYYTGYWDSGYTYHPLTRSPDIIYNFSTGSTAYLRIGDSSGARVNIVRVMCDDEFTSNVYKIVISSEVVSDTYSHFGQTFDRWIVVSYYDKNENKCSYAVSSISGYTNNMTDRTYYLSNSLTENEYYTAGYDAGYQIGSSDGQDIGYNTGYTAGQTAGYGSGYTAGQNDANSYTFFNLFGAVLDAPISVLMGILNFQILGVNLWALFTGLLTLAILILVIKLILGGK